MPRTPAPPAAAPDQNAPAARIAQGRTVRVALSASTPPSTRPRDPLAAAWMRTVGQGRREGWISAVVPSGGRRSGRPHHVLAHGRRANAETVAFELVRVEPIPPRTLRERMLRTPGSESTVAQKYAARASAENEKLASVLGGRR